MICGALVQFGLEYRARASVCMEHAHYKLRFHYLLILVNLHPNARG